MSAGGHGTPVELLLALYDKGAFVLDLRLTASMPGTLRAWRNTVLNTVYHM
jgi:hypothetical protein